MHAHAHRYTDTIQIHAVQSNPVQPAPSSLAQLSFLGVSNTAEASRIEWNSLRLTDSLLPHGLALRLSCLGFHRRGADNDRVPARRHALPTDSDGGGPDEEVASVIGGGIVGGRCGCG